MIEGKETRRERSSRRGIRNEATIEKRKGNRNKLRGANRKVYREVKKETPRAPRGEWQRLATEAIRITTQPPNSAYKGDHKEQHNRPRTKPKLEQVSSEV